ncbi:MAG: CMP-N-acetylneuraminic acid synthetase [Candidatus Omnitrophota bacterium]
MTGMKIAALLTGRGGSSLRDKNVRKVLGKPLLAYPALAATGAGRITFFYVSSDDKKILDAASRYGYVKIRRPEYLSAASAQHGDVIMHALEVMEELYSVIPDVLVVLLANSACVKTEWIDDCIREIVKDRTLSAVVPVCEDSDHHPFRAKKMSAGGLLVPFFDFGKKKVSTNRQDLDPAYFLCHNFWVLNLKRSVFSEGGQKPWEFMGNRIKPYPIKECCDVHCEKDLIRTKEWIAQNLKKSKRGK